MAVDTDRLKRLALARQGLTRPAAFGRGLPGARKALTQLGYVQIDTISVVSRAHDHTLFARVPNYRPEHLDRLVGRGEAFEYWFHAAAYLPMRDYRFSLPRKHAFRSGQRGWHRSRDQKLMRYVLDRIRAEGPLKARDFESNTPRRSGWWDWKPSKRALEQLFMQGDLMTSGRDGFQKVYDLTERVLPANVDDRVPSLEEYADHLIDVTLAAHGFATKKSFTYLRRGLPLRTAVDTRLGERCAAGDLCRQTLADGSRIYLAPEDLDARQRRPAARVRLLSPFDNAIIQRDRNQSIHGFDYQLECYVPAAKRRFGYFCLPILYRDEFVGRADCKAHRAEGRFEIISLHLESTTVERDVFPAEFAKAVTAYAAFNACRRIDLGVVSPAAWARPLQAACIDTALDPRQRADAGCDANDRSPLSP